jgi:hypothetical protein
MNDEEDQETPFQEMGAQQLAEKTAWVKLFLRQASKREESWGEIRSSEFV